jgi:hypothetical protein
MICTPAPPPVESKWAGKATSTSIAVIGSFLAACALLALLILIFRPSGYRSATKRAWDQVKWRLQGMPKSGTISVVVTDIEGYSGVRWCAGQAAAAAAAAEDGFAWQH